MSATIIYIVTVTVWIPCLHGYPHRNAFPEYPDFFEYQNVLDQQVDIPLPSNDPRWPAADVKVGQVGGVAVDKNNQVLIFHRGNRTWGQGTFNGDVFADASKNGPIQDDTILRLDPSTGDVIQHFGANRFYLPHGLTVDSKGNLWVTDVAMHQVMRIPKGKHEPDLTLGEFLVPGSDSSHFCKPTDVAVTSSGEFFVSDGYCNGRIMKYNQTGHLLSQWGHKYQGTVNDNDRYGLFIPHSLALLEDHDVICVADREHGRIQCYSAGLKDPTTTGKFLRSIDHVQFGAVYAISYDSNAQVIYAVNGRSNKVNGFTLDLDGTIREKWAPRGQGFGQPHDVAVSPDGKDVYVGEIYPDRVTKFSRI